MSSLQWEIINENQFLTIHSLQSEREREKKATMRQLTKAKEMRVELTR